MEPKSLSHYTDLQHLGGGAMGVVYRAFDTRLKRTVALKFLPPELTRDSDARQRFVHEAQAASTLDHPNICTIFEIDSAPDGQLFIAMAYYEGATLKKRLDDGPLPIGDAVDIALQIAQGLAKAHQAGIVHRDIKPANVMVINDGLVKIVDFGIAKLTGQTDMTRTGAALGTAAYMAPEQINGEVVDQQSDLWALGAVLFEMLTGRRAFPGDHPIAVVNAILNSEPRDLRTLRGEVPAALQHIVNRALARRREDRYRSAAELIKDLTAYGASIAPGAAPARGAWTTRRAVAAGAALTVTLAAAGAGGGMWWTRANERTWARVEALPEIRQLIDREEFAAAVSLAERVDRILPGDAAMAALWPEIAVAATVETQPPGADVYVKEYADFAAEWTPLGRTPVNDARLPRGLKRWRVEAAGFAPLELAGRPGHLNVALTRSDSVRPNMVPIPGGAANAWIAGMDPIDRVPVRDYQIDRYEVTNREFKAFVDAGGYSRRDWWKQPFIKDGRTLSFEEAMTQFRDPTGRPGPSTWELGTYPRGQEDHPVSGVSWYEAAAYAEYAGKSLPTVYHWVRAASTTLPSAIVPLSNFSGTGTAPAGSHHGTSAFGVYDIAGNVREWLWNASGNDRHVLGGAFHDPLYMFSFASTRMPFDRSAGNGFRCVVYSEGRVPADTGGSVALSHRDYRRETPVADAVFRAYLNQFDYDPKPLDAKTETVSEATNWKREKVSFAAAYGSERLTVHLFLPKTGRAPYQTLVYFPGSGAIVQTNGDQFVPPDVEFLARSGRAVVFPIYKGTFERNDGYTSTWASATHAHSEYLIRQVKDFRRSVDYLETRSELDVQKLAYYGNSWGGRMAAIIPAVERRIKLNIVLLGGLAAGRALPEVDQINYITRVTVPTLMINGRYDAIEPLESAQLPMFEFWGTPAEHKRHVVFETGHGPFPPHALIKEVLDWIDRYFGSVA
jgi:dienelactone hydrolase